MWIHYILFISWSHFCLSWTYYYVHKSVGFSIINIVFSLPKSFQRKEHLNQPSLMKVSFFICYIRVWIFIRSKSQLVMNFPALSSTKRAIQNDTSTGLSRYFDSRLKTKKSQWYHQIISQSHKDLKKCSLFFEHSDTSKIALCV